MRLRVGPDGRRLSKAGDFNAEIPVSQLRQGLNIVEFKTRDRAGNEIAQTVKLFYQPNKTWPLPYIAHWQDARNSGELQRIAQVVDGLWEVKQDQLSIVEPGYDRIVAIGDRSWQDYQVETSVTIDEYGKRYGIGVILRWNGHSDDPFVTRNPRSGWFPLGAIGWFRNGRLAIYGNRWQTSSRQVIRPKPDATYMLKMQVHTLSNGRPLYRLKVWPKGKPEPKRWSLVARGRRSDPKQGSMALVAHRARVSFGDVKITPLH